MAYRTASVYLKAVDPLLIHALVNILHLLCKTLEQLLLSRKKVKASFKKSYKSDFISNTTAKTIY